MSKKDIQLLLIVFGILIGFASWQFIYKPNQAKAEKVKTENTALQNEVNELEVLDAKKEDFLADIETMKADCTKITNSFASGLLTEDEIMYLYNMEIVDANEVKVPSVSMSAATEVPYTTVAVTTDAASTTDATATAETAADGTAAEQVEVFQPVDEGIKMYDSKTTVSFTTSYNGLKNVVKYVYEIPARKAISSVSLTASENGYLTGTMELDFYCMTGTDVPYSYISIPGVPLGTNNIFGVLNGAQGGNAGAAQAAGEADVANEE